MQFLRGVARRFRWLHTIPRDMSELIPASLFTSAPLATGSAMELFSPGTSPEEKFQIQVQRVMHKRWDYCHERSCGRCWLLRENCMCSLTEPVVTRHHLIVYMHFRGTFLRVGSRRAHPATSPGLAGRVMDGCERAGAACVLPLGRWVVGAVPLP